MAGGINFSLGATKAPTSGVGHTATAQRNGTKRSHAALGDDSDDDATPAKQVVTHFNAKGAFDVAAKHKEEKKPLVITPQANRDWREASKSAQAQRRNRHGLPTVSAAEEAKNREEEIKRLENANKPIFGLNVKTGSPEEQESQEVVHDEVTNNNDTSHTAEQTVKPKTDDELAMDALLGIQQQSDLTIPAVTEEQAFQRDYKDAPPMASLAQYAATPVEEFGAALLRGMGWKEGHGIGRESGQKIQKAKVVERRPALLGIGAKEDAAIKEELGAWGRGSKKGKSDQVYNPVIMRNKRTGEEVTEEEMKAKLEQQQSQRKPRELEDGSRSHRDSDRDDRPRKERSRRDEHSDEEYERRRRERRREKDYSDAEYERSRRDGRRERDRDDRDDRSSRRKEYSSHSESKGYSGRSDRKDKDERDRYKDRRRDDYYDRDDRRSDRDKRRAY